MAKIKVEKTAKKVTKTVTVLESSFAGKEPIWDTARAEKFTDAEFDNALRKSLAYYNYYNTTKDLKKHLIQWLRDTDIKVHKLSKETIDRFVKAPDSLIPLTAPAIVKASIQGMPLKEKHVKYLVDTVNKVVALSAKGIAAEEADVEVKADAPKARVPNIQDRLNEKMSGIIGELEGEFDEVLSKSTKFKAYEFFVSNNVPQAQLGKFERVLAPRLEEIQLALTGKDEQLTEGYSYLKPADFKRVIAWITDVLAGIEQYRGVKKATKRAATRKPPQKEKLVAKLKYLKTDNALKLVSINPVDIIGAQTLYVYNVKTRKIGRYVAEDMGGSLNVKGTTIVGYDANKSTSKTLRKADVQLKELLAANKLELRKFMDNIKTIESKLNGRINADTVLLKVL
jgi:hypothetical protein